MPGKLSSQKRIRRRQVVALLRTQGVEPKRAHSEAGFMLNRWPFEAVAMAVVAGDGEGDPVERAKSFLSNV